MPPKPRGERAAFSAAGRGELERGLITTRGAFEGERAPLAAGEGGLFAAARAFGAAPLRAPPRFPSRAWRHMAPASAPAMHRVTSAAPVADMKKSSEGAPAAAPARSAAPPGVLEGGSAVGVAPSPEGEPAAAVGEEGGAAEGCKLGRGVGALEVLTPGGAGDEVGVRERAPL